MCFFKSCVLNDDVDYSSKIKCVKFMGEIVEFGVNELWIE